MMDMLYVMKRLADLQKDFIYVHSCRESLGSDEWEFGYVIDYLPDEFWDLKRRATSFQRIESFVLSGGATYSGAWPTIEQALEEGIKYVDEKILPKIIRVGDKVKIVKYGSLLWMPKTEWGKLRQLYAPPLPDKPSHILHEHDTLYVVDKAPELVGTEDVVKEIKYIQGTRNYALVKTAWFNRDQLQKIIDK